MIADAYRTTYRKASNLLARAPRAVAPFFQATQANQRTSRNPQAGTKITHQLRRKSRPAFIDSSDAVGRDRHNLRASDYEKKKKSRFRPSLVGEATEGIQYRGKRRRSRFSELLLRATSRSSLPVPTRERDAPSSIIWAAFNGALSIRRCRRRVSGLAARLMVVGLLPASLHSKPRVRWRSYRTRERLVRRE